MAMIKAKDTAMSRDEIKDKIIAHGWILSPAKMEDMIAQYQEVAEISFKAGELQAYGIARHYG